MSLPEPPAHVKVSKRGDALYYQDEAGLTVRARRTIEGPYPGRGKGYRPEPPGGRSPGHHRGHLIPENAVAEPADVNVPENIISEAPGSNLGPKKSLEYRAARTAPESGEKVEFVSDPIRKAASRYPSLLPTTCSRTAR